MGRITTPARVENNFDVERAEVGQISPEAVRSIEIPDALVDTGASSVALPTSLIQQLGLRPVRKAQSRTAGGLREMTIYSAVRLTIQGRDGIFQVTELPEGSPALIGQLPLEWLDLVPFPKEQSLRPNPAHGNEWIIEML